jgi:hypothetical protein
VVFLKILISLLGFYAVSTGKYCGRLKRLHLTLGVVVAEREEVYDQ